MFRFDVCIVCLYSYYVKSYIDINSHFRKLILKCYNCKKGIIMATVPLLTTIYSSHAIQLERVAAKFGADVNPYLDRIDKRISVVLNGLPKRALTTKQRNAVILEIDMITREELQAYTAGYKANNKELAVSEGAFNSKALQSVTTGYEAAIPSAGIVNQIAIKSPIKIGDDKFTTYNSYVNAYWQKQSQQINDTVKTGFVTGQNNAEIARLIKEQLPGDINRAKNAARTMARTGTNHYANASTRAFVDVNDKVLTGFRSISTLDNRTSRICSALDQIVFKADDPNIPWPPSHPNCRRRMVYEIDGRYKYDDSASERQSKFDVGDDVDAKRVSSKSMFYSELGKLKASDQDAYLGPTLGKAFRKMDDPELFAKQIIDSTYNPLTIAEMKAGNNALSDAINSATGFSAKAKSSPINKAKSKISSINKSNTIKAPSGVRSTVSTTGGTLPRAINGKASLNRSLTGDESAYLGYYKGDGFYKSNDILRNPGKYSAGEIGGAKTMRESIDNAISKSSLDNDSSLYRGIRDKELFKDLDSSSIGASIPISTAQSVAKDSRVALTYSGAIKVGDDYVSAGSEAIVMKIAAKKGQKALDMELLEGIGGTQETEMLLSSTGNYVITGVQEKFAPDGKLALKIIEVDYVD
jgi:SPP1 gp7 family putative phage head morphogenesis protein